jgi:hypothetical protein
LWGVHLVIRRRSWTRRCYTVLIASDLKTLGYTMIPNVRVKPKTLLDVRIQQAIDQPSDQRPYIATADDVVGVA